MNRQERKWNYSETSTSKHCSTSHLAYKYKPKTCTLTKGCCWKLDREKLSYNSILTEGPCFEFSVLHATERNSSKWEKLATSSSLKQPYFVYSAPAQHADRGTGLENLPCTRTCKICNSRNPQSNIKASETSLKQRLRSLNTERGINKVQNKPLKLWKWNFKWLRPCFLFFLAHLNIYHKLFLFIMWI